MMSEHHTAKPPELSEAPTTTMHLPPHTLAPAEMHLTTEELLEPGTATVNREDGPEYIDCGHYYEVYADNFPLGIAWKPGYSYTGTASIGDKAYGVEGEAKERQSVQRMRKELDELCESQ